MKPWRAAVVVFPVVLLAGCGASTDAEEAVRPERLVTYEALALPQPAIGRDIALDQFTVTVPEWLVQVPEGDPAWAGEHSFLGPVLGVPGVDGSDQPEWFMTITKMPWPEFDGSAGEALERMDEAGCPVDLHTVEVPGADVATIAVEHFVPTPSCTDAVSATIPTASGTLYVKDGDDVLEVTLHGDEAETIGVLVAVAASVRVG